MKRRRMAVDVAMTALLPCLMAYSLIGETFHEAAGVAMLALFIGHHVLNRGWLKGLFRGRYTPYRIVQTIVDLLLCVVMVSLPLSGILMSKHLFLFLPVTGLAATARTVHLLAAYWGFLLMSFHLGLHLERMLKKRPPWLMITAAAVSLYGVTVLFRRDILDYLFLRSRFLFFDPSASLSLFILDYISVMVLFAGIGCRIGQLLKGRRGTV